mmetsp:Transcript_105686/g.295925  ORF Transcript_105686/g.295925 Transcript_105686/m.295925 type:complete len:216 (-) Transcript_105686:761-1408(-)
MSFECSANLCFLSMTFCRSISLYSSVSRARIIAWMSVSSLSSSLRLSLSSICLRRYAWFSKRNCFNRFCLMFSASAKWRSDSSCWAFARIASLSPAPLRMPSTFSCSCAISSFWRSMRCCISRARCASCSSRAREYSFMASASRSAASRRSCWRLAWSIAFSSKTLRICRLCCSFFSTNLFCSASISSTILATCAASSSCFWRSSSAFSFLSYAS